MERPVCYDVTRLLTRVLNATPNGIDRVDITLARHVLFSDAGERLGVTSTGLLGPRVLARRAARDAVEGIASHWGEARPGGREAKPDGGEVKPEGDTDDPVYRATVARLTGRAPAPGAPKAPVRRATLRSDIVNGLRWTARHGIPVRRRPARHVPKGGVYLNASQFPLWVPGTFRWLEERPDVKAAFFIHDLLPISMPEYFPDAEFERHKTRLVNFARFGAAALVTTQTVANDLRAHLATLGRASMPIFVAPMPVAPIFSEPRHIDPDLAGHPFFLLCATFEPRKNHLMLLAAWRELVNREGKAAPKLVLVGTRGWKYDLILDLIERSPPLRDHVIVARGLSTPGLKRLMDNARAVLMPSFAEGYGLPVHEALAAGAPVVASDVPVFREIDAPGLTLLSPRDGDAWLETARALAATERPATARAANPGWSRYFGALDAFLSAL